MYIGGLPLPSNQSSERIMHPISIKGFFNLFPSPSPPLFPLSVKSFQVVAKFITPKTVNLIPSCLAGCVPENWVDHLGYFKIAIDSNFETLTLLTGNRCEEN